MQQAEEAIRVTIEYCRKGRPPDRDEIRAVPEEAKNMLLQFETLVIKNDLLYRRFVHRDGTTKHLQLILPTKLRREYIEPSIRIWVILARPKPVKQSLGACTFLAGAHEVNCQELYCLQ